MVKNFDRKPAISLKTLTMGLFNTLLWLNQGFWAQLESLNLLYMTAVLSCAFNLEYILSFWNIRCNKYDIWIYCRIHYRINLWTGKLNISWNHYNSMLATINIMFVNEKIMRIYSFCPFSTWNTRQMHLRGVLWQNSHPP